MSLTVDGVWKAGVWASTVWASGVWYEPAGAPVTPTTVGGGGGKRKKRRAKTINWWEREAPAEPKPIAVVPPAVIDPKPQEIDTTDDDLILTALARILH